jgi:glycosyltransferase involved in cell wall biosynthesis
VINSHCKNLGWLFNDLLRYFEAAGCTASHEPIEGADAYIVIRSSEAHLCPDLSRAVVQFHCMEPRLMGTPAVLDKAGAFCFTHYDQPELLREMGISIDRPQMMRPIGAHEGFKARTATPRLGLVVGWVGRDTGRKGANLFVEIMRELASRRHVFVKLLGANLNSLQHRLSDAGVSSASIPRHDHDPFRLDVYQGFYDSIDVLCITSETEAGPLPLFEALACGVPVVSTPVGWAPMVAASNGQVKLCERVDEFVSSLPPRCELPIKPFKGFLWPDNDPPDYSQWRLQDWIDENVVLATELMK